MINREDYVEWALLGYGLCDAREHLDHLIKDMDSPDFDEVSFGCQLSHIYAHLNQAWNGRNKKGELSEAEYDEFSEYPKDLKPNEGWPPLAEPGAHLKVAKALVERLYKLEEE